MESTKKSNSLLSNKVGINIRNPFKITKSYERELIFLLFLGLSLFTYIALFSFNPFDQSPFSGSYPPTSVKNLSGTFGAIIASCLVYYFGYVSYLLPIPLLTMSILFILEKQRPFGVKSSAGWLSLLFVVSTVSPLYYPNFHINGISFPISGSLGKILSNISMLYLGKGGYSVTAIVLFCSGIILISRTPIITPVFKFISSKTKMLSLKLNSLIVGKVRNKKTRNKKIGQEQELLIDVNKEDVSPKKLIEAPIFRKSNETTPCLPLNELPAPIEEEEKEERAYLPPKEDIFKKTDLSVTLNEAQKREFEQIGENLTKAFADFSIKGRVVAIQPGPVVTVYEFEHNTGIKLSKITSLTDDIALALKVDSIFIHPVSGKRVIGIQVPNNKRETVLFGDIINSNSFQKAPSPLTFAMGKNLKGESFIADLATMPHLLAAGQTGSGKSVAINSLLCSIIMKASPEEVKMILVDPKILELKIYEGIPHLLMPVITEPDKASMALKWATSEMDRRYKLMELARVRHIASFNSFWKKASTEEKFEIEEKLDDQNIDILPYIVIVIDEMADLMLTAPKDVEGSIQRLAQKARACGIHLVLATQRPSVDVITGVIKANLPSRIAFKVFSRGDSRTILDCMGAEKLLGKGDMLYLKPGNSRLERIQGAFLEDDEVVNLVESIKKNYKPHYDEKAISWIEESIKSRGNDNPTSKGLGEDDDLDNDPKWDIAIGIAQSQGNISASFLQRQMKIGYNRAARIIEKMEKEGLVSKADGSKPRTWLGSSYV